MKSWSDPDITYELNYCGGWLGVVCDSGDSVPGYTDTNVGWSCEPLDRIKMKIADSNQF